MSNADEEKIDIIIQALSAIQEELKQNDQKMKTLFDSSQKELATKISQDLLTQSTQLGITIGRQIGEHTERLEESSKKTDEKIQQGIDETKKLNEVISSLSTELKCLSDFRLKYEPQLAKIQTIETQLISIGLLKSGQEVDYGKTGDLGSPY